MFTLPHPSTWWTNFCGYLSHDRNGPCPTRPWELSKQLYPSPRNDIWKAQFRISRPFPRFYCFWGLLHHPIFFGHLWPLMWMWARDRMVSQCLWDDTEELDDPRLCFGTLFLPNGGFHKWGEYPKMVGLFSWKIRLRWMIEGYSPISGNLQIGTSPFCYPLVS